jgi:hypothetical protein
VVRRDTTIEDKRVMGMHGCTTLSRDAFLSCRPLQLRESHSRFGHRNTGILQLPASSSNFAAAPRTTHDDMGTYRKHAVSRRETRSDRYHTSSTSLDYDSHAMTAVDFELYRNLPIHRCMHMYFAVVHSPLARRHSSVSLWYWPEAHM